MKKVLSILMALVILSLTACTPSVSAVVLQSEKPRVTAPQVGQGDLEALVGGNSEFAFELYQILKK